MIVFQTPYFFLNGTLYQVKLLLIVYDNILIFKKNLGDHNERK